MLRITEQRAPGRIVLKLEGRLSNDFVTELAACWHAAMTSGRDAAIWVDLRDVCVVSLEGQALLTRMYRAGVRFLSRDCVMRELVREISES